MPTPQVTRQILREINQLRQDPPEGIRVCTSEENMLDLTGIIEGPAGTPYEGGYFRVKFNFTDDFPAAPPKCHFITKLFHPNVSSAGEICVNTLKKDWQPSFGISHILVTIKCLLIYPNPESALDEEAGKMLLEDYSAFERRAKLICEVHARPKVRPPEFNTPSRVQSAPSIECTTTAPPTTTTTTTTTTSIPTPINQIRRSTSPLPPAAIKSAAITLLTKSTTTAAPTVPFHPSVNSSPISTTIIATHTTTESDLQQQQPPSTAEAGDTTTSTTTNTTTTTTTKLSEKNHPPIGKSSGKRVNSVAAGGVEKKKKALKRL